MARTDNEQEVCRKAIGQRRYKSHPGAEAEEQHCHPHSRHGEEEERGGRVDNLHHLAYGALHGLRGVLHIDQESGHTAKHTSRPLCILARGLAVVENILGHAIVLLHIVLDEHLAAHLR